MAASARLTRRTFAATFAAAPLLGILLDLESCLKELGSPDPGADATDGPEIDVHGQQTTPPDSPTLVGFRLSMQGMYEEPVYSIRQVEGGFECTATPIAIYWPAMDGDTVDHCLKSTDGSYYYEPYTAFGDPLDPATSWFSRTLLDDADMAQLLDILVEHAVLSWDGFDEKRDWPEGFAPTDTGASFDLKILLSDGRLITAHGIDSYPDGYNAAINDIRAFFEQHEDYSQLSE